VRVISFSRKPREIRRFEIDDERLFSRNIEVDIFDEGTFIRLEGRLRDTRLSEPLHGMDVTMRVSVFDGVITEIEGSMPHWPLQECLAGLDSLSELLGAKILPGFSDLVKSTVGSNRGCTHLAALVMNMGNASVQGRGAYLRKHMPENEMRDKAMAQSAEQFGLIDSCVAWREDGPIVRRWREEHPQDDPRY
jgi:hypothetical protein